MWLLSIDPGLSEINIGVSKVCGKAFIDSSFNCWVGGAGTPGVFAVQSSSDEVSK